METRSLEQEFYLERRAVFQHGRRMIQVLLQDCHARLRKFRQRIDQEKTTCCEFMGEIGTNLLLQRVTEQAREQRVIRNAALENKFRKLPNPTSPRNDKLVHNLSSKELTKDQMQVLRHKASFNTADAKPVNLIAAVGSILSQTEATEETKSLIRHQVSSLLMAHRPREVLPKIERYALRELNADKDLVIVPADKGSSTTNFTFDWTIYEQVKGTSLGSPISGFIAEAVLQRLESLVFQHHRPKFWAPYLDDTFVFIDRDQLLTFKEHLNAVFPEIKSTMEAEENNRLTFLDVLVCRKDCGGLKTKVFRKATNTMQVLNFNNNHQSATNAAV
nr:unnamed protein product [Spirometra erinaceieuropaei]